MSTTPMNDGLDALDDDALGARFAVEVVAEHPREPIVKAPFATSVDVLLPILERWVKKHGRRLSVSQTLHGWFAEVVHTTGGRARRHSAISTTLPRSICMAMLRAKNVPWF